MLPASESYLVDPDVNLRMSRRDKGQGPEKYKDGNQEDSQFLHKQHKSKLMPLDFKYYSLFLTGTLIIYTNYP